MAAFTQRMYCGTKEIVRGHRLDIHSFEPLFTEASSLIYFASVEGNSGLLLSKGDVI